MDCVKMRVLHVVWIVLVVDYCFYVVCAHLFMFFACVGHTTIYCGCASDVRSTICVVAMVRLPVRFGTVLCAYSYLTIVTLFFDHY